MLPPLRGARRARCQVLIADSRAGLLEGSPVGLIFLKDHTQKSVVYCKVGTTLGPDSSRVSDGEFNLQLQSLWQATSDLPPSSRHCATLLSTRDPRQVPFPEEDKPIVVGKGGARIRELRETTKVWITLDTKDVPRALPHQDGQAVS